MSATILRRNVGLAIALSATAGLTVWSCSSETVVGPPGTGGGGTAAADEVPPSVNISVPDTLIDVNEDVEVTVNASDNLSLKRVEVVFTGLTTEVFVDTFTTATTSFTRDIVVPVGGASGGTVSIVATATDGAGNQATDSVAVRVVDNDPPIQSFVSLSPPSSIPAGDTLVAIVNIKDPSGVGAYGVRLLGTDSIGNAIIISGDSVPADTLTDLDVTDTLSIAVPDTLSPGSYQIVLFAGDQSGNSSVGDTTSINVVDVRAPTGQFLNPQLDSLVVAGDSMKVRVQATDLSGLQSVTLQGFAVRGIDTLGTADTIIRFFEKKAEVQGVRDTTVVRFLLPVTTDSTAESVTLLAILEDVAGNTSTISSRIRVVGGRFVEVMAPTTGAAHPVGTPLEIDILAFSPNLITNVGYTVRGVVTDSVNVSFAVAPTDSINLVDSLVLAANADLGNITITPFAADLEGNQISGVPVTVALTDQVSPTITFLNPAAGALVRIGDSVRVQVQVQDNKGVTNVLVEGVSHRGDPTLGTDSIVERFESKSVSFAQNADTVVIRDLAPVAEIDDAETAYLRVTATDSSGNTAVDSLAVDLVSGPDLAVLTPSDSAVVAPGSSLLLRVQAQAVTGVKKVGYLTTGVLVSDDTTTTIPTATPQVRDTTIDFNVAISPTQALGFFDITPFGRDSLGNQGTGPVVTVEVVADPGVSDANPPLITVVNDSRIEVDDSLTFTVQDLDGSNIAKIGFYVIDAADGDTLSRDSVVLGGTTTFVVQNFGFALDTVTVDTTAREVILTAFAEDVVGNRGGISLTGVAVAEASGAADTLTLVAGRTFALPSGGSIADAIYNVNRNEIYMSNSDLDRLEVFDVSTLTFDNDGIPVGSRPWGLAFWPSDTLGSHLDRVVVANSGGTNLSIVDIPTQNEEVRYPLPEYLLQAVAFEVDDATNTVQLKVIDFEYSDRPQFIATVCSPTPGLDTCHGDSIIVVYSTTPTIDQGEQTLRGTVRWENIGLGSQRTGGIGGAAANTAINFQSHFFYEHATRIAGTDFDTLQIQISRGLDRRVATRQDPAVLVGAACAVMADFTAIPFLDTTFVRGSGNFRRVLIGEGGSQTNPRFGFARAMTYRLGVQIDRDINGPSTFDARDGNQVLTPSDSTCNATIAGVPFFGGYQEDAGLSEAIDVGDFISNTATSVRSISTNFNGLTNLIRADSIYVLDEFLRLQGLVQAEGLNPSMDIRFDHCFDASDAVNSSTCSGPGGGLINKDTARLLFAARSDANIDIFDTRFFANIAQIPVKDPIIGPMRVAQQPDGTQILIGVTANGVVTVQLPDVTTPFPTSPF